MESVLSDNIPTLEKDAKTENYNYHDYLLYGFDWCMRECAIHGDGLSSISSEALALCS